MSAGQSPDATDAQASDGQGSQTTDLQSAEIVLIAREPSRGSAHVAFDPGKTRSLPTSQEQAPEPREE